MARKKKIVKPTEKQTADNFHYEKVVEDFSRESDMHIKRLEEELQSIIDALKIEMNETVQSLPKKIANMTIETYIKEFLKQREQPAQSEMEVDVDGISAPVLDELSNVPLPFPSGSMLTDPPTGKRQTAKRNGKKVQKKAPPPSTRRTRTKNPLFQTPANNSKTPSCFRSFEGTPLLGRDARGLNFREKPRDMTPCDKISAFQLRMYSDRGSPLQLGNNISEEMSRKIQDSLRMLMEEEGK